MIPYHTDGRGSPPNDRHAPEKVSYTRFRNQKWELLVLLLIMIPIYISAAFGWLFGSLFLNDDPPEDNDRP